MLAATLGAFAVTVLLDHHVLDDWLFFGKRAFDHGPARGPDCTPPCDPARERTATSGRRVAA